MIDYDSEAEIYDSSRGGEPRAAAAARAVDRLLPDNTGVVLDVACGTGIVTRHLAREDRTLIGIDSSPGMLTIAATWLGRSVLLGEAARLPIKTGSVHGVTFVWFLHLCDDAEPLIKEAARVLSHGGVLITTVDKNAAAFTVDSDVAAVISPLRQRRRATDADRHEHVSTLAAVHGLRPAGATTFAGHGQGRSPLWWRERILAGRFRWSRQADPDHVGDVCRRLEELPDGHTARPDPVYRLVAFSRPG